MLEPRADWMIRVRRLIPLLTLAVLARSAVPVGALPVSAPPAEPVWPSPVLVAEIRGLLEQYYDQEATAGSPVSALAPRTEAEKASSAKDPDTLWEQAVSGAACHGATTRPSFESCAGKRLAATFGRGDYAGGLTLFDASRGYYANDAYARMADFYALYHAFAHDYDASRPAGTGYDASTARDSQDYHRAMVRAYEAHSREIYLRIFRDARDDGGFQTSLTRAAGLFETGYLPVVEFLESHDAWGSPSDRRNAFAIVNALNQRIFWEWVWTQTNGPATAGFVNLGSQATYDLGRPGSGTLDGTDRFRYEFEGGAEDIPSLRTAAQDDPQQGGTNGFWFDADYPIPGEWWCYGTYGLVASDALGKCLGQAAKAGKAGGQSAPGPFSPYTQYYGDPGVGNPCDGRAYTDTGISCGDTSLGSIGEEWLWNFAGLRAGLYLIQTLSVQGDPDLPARALGTVGQVFTLGQSPAQTAYSHVTERLGYGVSGFHGGAGYNDDLEWLWSGNGAVRAIRTFSAATHDGELQNGRFSVGENDVPAGANPADRLGSTWGKPGLGYQEYPGGMENHSAGPSSLYGTTVLGLVLADKLGDRSGSQSGLAGSLFDASHRNNVEEFRSWLWLAAGSYHRCPPSLPGEDPAADACIAAASGRRVPLYEPPNPVSPSLRFDYLWREKGPAAQTLIEASAIASSETSCAGRPGVPWRYVRNRDAGSDGAPLVPRLHDEGSFGAYNELFQGYGGLMRLIAERWPLQAADPAFAQERSQLLKPWYDTAHQTVEGIVGLYGNQLGYVPDIENSTCMGTNPDPGDPSPAMISWQQGTGASVEATVVRRAMWYSVATQWHWWYAADWLDLAPAAW